MRNMNQPNNIREKAARTIGDAMVGMVGGVVGWNCILIGFSEPTYPTELLELDVE